MGEKVLSATVCSTLGPAAAAAAALLRASAAAAAAPLGRPRSHIGMCGLSPEPLRLLLVLLAALLPSAVVRLPGLSVLLPVRTPLLLLLLLLLPPLPASARPRRRGLLPAAAAVSWLLAPAHARKD
jgi:hypothetical protein